MREGTITSCGSGMTQKDALHAADEGISASDGRAEFSEVLSAVEAEATPERLLEGARKLQDALDDRQIAETAEIVTGEALTDTPHA